MYKIIIVDDEKGCQETLENLINNFPQFQIVAKTDNITDAQKLINALKPHLIFLDIEMPEMNGIQFLETCRDLGIQIPVIVLSSVGKNRPEITFKCLSLGAKDFIIKPSGSISLDIDTVQQEVISKIKFFYHSKHWDHKTDLKETIDKWTHKKEYISSESRDIDQTYCKTPPNKLSSVTIADKIMRISSFEVLTIGISTGGPYALRRILPQFPPDFPLPIVIVQHMPPNFTTEFAMGLNDICQIPVKEAEDNESMSNAKIYIAPGDHHILVNHINNRKVITLSKAPPENNHRPSAEILFDSATQVYHNRLISVIMTGMGKDGARAIRRVHLNGGITFAQSEKTCVIYGMPKVAVELGGIDEILDLDDIPKRIIEIVDRVSH